MSSYLITIMQPDDWADIEYFKEGDFKCPCCGEERVDKFFIEKLDLARSLAGVPFIINSGYRCPKHNKEVGGVDDSAHVLGMAGDVSAESSYQRMRVVEGMVLAGFKRIGIASSMVHGDTDDNKPQVMLWLYK